MLLSILASLAYTMNINYTHHFKQAIHLEDFGAGDTSFEDVYTKPWCRCTPYIWGLMLGLMYH